MIGLALTACDDNDPIFKETSDVRVAKQMTECDRTLKSAAAGWKMSYYPNEEKFGSFNLFFRFRENNQVTMGTDYNIDWQESTYSLNAGEGVVLNFDTYGSLHELADPGIGVLGKGYEGDFEMLVQKITPNTIYCKGRKHGKAMNLIRAEEQDWEDLKSYARNTMLLMPGSGEPFFRNLYVGEKGVATLIYNNQTRFMNVNYYNDGVYINKELPVIVTSEGFRLGEAMIIDGKPVQKFAYNKTSKTFVTSESELDGEIRFSDTSTVVFPKMWERFRNENFAYNLTNLSGSIMPTYMACRQAFPQFGGVQVYWNLSNVGDFFALGSVSPSRYLLVEMEETILREDVVVFAMTGVLRQMGDVIEGEATSMLENKNILTLLSLWFNEKGYTIVPMGKKSFCLVSRLNSSYWFQF